MSNTTNPKLRSGFIISLESCMRYLGSKGHGFSFADVQPWTRSHHNPNKNEQRICDEERRMNEREDLESGQVERVQDIFRHLRRKAPEDLRVRLVLPHTFIRIVKHKKFGRRQQKCLFLPTGTADSVEDSTGAFHDFDRLRIFMKITSDLLVNGADYEAVKFTPDDFTFSTIPAAALFEPIFNDNELKELMKAGRGAIELYGISVREFMEPYRAPESPLVI